MTESKLIRWGIIGPGEIARTFSDGIAHSTTGKLVAVASRNPKKPELARDFPGARIVAGYEALLTDPEIDAVYISTPHPYHAEWAIKAIRAGKHVLVEKPIALNAFDAQAIFHEAAKAKVFAGEAYMYRVHPQTAKLLDVVKSGAIGDLRIIRSNFGFNMGSVDPKHRLFAEDLAGGGILDIGGYPASMARLIAGSVAGKPFLEPQSVTGTAHIGETGVDEWASAVLSFPNGIIAEVSCSIMADQENVLQLIGSQGRIEVKDFWFASGEKGGVGTIKVFDANNSHKTIEVKEERWLYSFEVDAAGKAIQEGRREFAAPGMSWADSVGNLQVLDQWRKAIGLEFSIETAAKRTATVSGAPLRKGSKISTRRIPGLEKAVSSVALGFEYFQNFASASLTLDAFFEAGGNLFDTAHEYGDGVTEMIFGDWHSSRKIPRNDFVVIGKGAHTPVCYPDVIGRELSISLERMKLDYVDIYFMHRDNLAVPVDEFVDAIDQEIRAGRIRGLSGGSNWTLERMDQAIAYAKKNGKAVPNALSNNFSLAEMVRPLWEGCVSSSDDAWKKWLKEKQMPNFAWSSQARGFFTDYAGRDKLSDEEMVQAWYSDKNFARRDRAIELAGKLGRKPIHIALAYVLAQPLTVVPLIGPRTLTELEDSLSALEIKLTPEQVAWLEG